MGNRSTSYNTVDTQSSLERDIYDIAQELEEIIYETNKILKRSGGDKALRKRLSNCMMRLRSITVFGV